MTSFHHQPEAQHQKSSAIHKLPADYPIFWGNSGHAAYFMSARGGADVLAAFFVIDLPDLGGAERLRKLDVPVQTHAEAEPWRGRTIWARHILGTAERPGSW